VTITFATCGPQPLVAPDDEPLAAALASRGIDVAPTPWTEIDPYAVIDASPVLLRSTWDYHRLPTLFADWLRALEDSGRVVWNSPRAASDNIDKIYLQQLERAGVPIPRTRWLDRVEASSIRAALAEERWDQAVLKPRIAATAYGTFLVDGAMALSDDDLGPARACGALLQEFVPEIVDRGEVSLMYCEGTFTHAVVKRAADGDYRVQSDFGGTREALEPSAALLAFGGRVLGTLADPCLYARVDVVETSRGLLLMELELIEPELFFLVVPAAADRFADAILRRLKEPASFFRFA
jgi:glutathione synthase/RimK-type ligase-like ATP-grasp enzyme